MPDSPQAGWFPDPWSDGQLRWWDGSEWTGGTTSLETHGPLVTTVAPPAPTPPPEEQPLWRQRSVQIPAIAVLTAVVVIAVAAFVSWPGSPSPRTAVGIGVPPTTVAAVGGAAGTSVADRINLSAADFPPEWSSSVGSDAGTTTTSQDAQVAACAGAPDPATSASKDVPSADFSDQGMDVSSDVTIMKSPKLAQQDLAATASPKGLACLRWFFPSFAASSAPVGTQIHLVSVDPLPVATYGDGSFGFRMVMNVTGHGTTAVATIDEIGFVRGSLEVTGSFTSAPGPFPAAMESRYMALLASRAAKAQPNVT
jgi:hypothetical protein